MQHTAPSSRSRLFRPQHQGAFGTLLEPQYIGSISLRAPRRAGVQELWAAEHLNPRLVSPRQGDVIATNALSGNQRGYGSFTVLRG